MTEPAAPAPTRRADAERNRERILAAAREALADPESPVSMAAISRRAEVGMATLYRNFPSRRDLLEALYVDEVDAVCAAAEAAAGSTPGATLTAWLRRFFAFFNHKRPIAAELLEHAASDDPVFGQSRARILAAAQPLLTAAQKSGEIRPDLTLEQILDLLVAIAKIPGDPDRLEPILATALDGLRLA